VLVRVRAAGVDQGVWHVVTGLPYIVRLGLRPVVDHTFAMTDVPAAIRHLREGHPGGKVVIVM
jgi:NADPH:quinone reductase-like Zn-dependent oxidoreductase